LRNYKNKQTDMQAKIIGGLFGLLFGGVCFEAGRISQREQKDDYSTTKV